MTPLALTTNWWSRWYAVEPIEAALAKALQNHWVPLFSKRLKLNKRRGVVPDSWTSLATLAGLDYVKLQRRKTGRCRATSQEFLNLARILKIDLDELFPDDCTQLAETACILCKGHVTATEARAYAHFCLARPPAYYLSPRPSGNGSLDPSSLVRVVSIMKHDFASSAECERAIRKVVEHIEPSLERASVASA